MNITLADDEFYLRIQNGCRQRKEFSHIPIELSLVPSSRSATLFAYNKPHPQIAAPNIENPENYLQSSSLDGIFYNYFERWDYNVASGLYVLGRIYSHIYLIENEEEWQIYSIHIDADEPVDKERYHQKAVPHLHIESAPFPFNHYHHPFLYIAECTDIYKVDDIFTLIIANIMEELTDCALKSDDWKRDINLKLTAQKNYRRFYEFLETNPN